MKWSFSITKVAGIDVRVHVTFLLLLAYWGFNGYQHGGAPAAKLSVFFIMLLFLCVLLHEFGHALAAKRYGIRTPDITLYPIGGVARLERMPENPVQELVIAIAGPMVNVVIALVLWLALGMPLANFTDQNGALRMLTAQLMEVNAMLIAFNLIPAFPMDGGRVLRSLLAMRMSHVDATRIAARTGQGVAVLLALIGFFGVPEAFGSVPVLSLLVDMFGTNGNPFLVFIAMFVFSGAQQEATYAGMRAAVAELRVSDAMSTHFATFPADMSIAHAAEKAAREMQPEYPVTDSSHRFLGMVLRNEILQAAADQKGSLEIASLAHKIPQVHPNATFNEAFQLMHESGSPLLPVVDGSGQVVGLVSLNLMTGRIRKG